MTGFDACQSGAQPDDARMALFGSIETIRAQLARADYFAASFDYLREVFRPESSAAARLRSTPVGETHRIDLSGGAFALEQAYQTKRRTDGFFESHQVYIDVQVIFEGEELMEVLDIERAEVRDAYDPKRDLVTYVDAKAASILHVRVGEAAVFFPADVHMPCLIPAGAAPGLVRKTVIKIPVTR
jgi:YhcH/YjgK/YiaL family protein